MIQLQICNFTTRPLLMCYNGIISRGHFRNYRGEKIMKKISFITALFGTAVLMTGCKNVENIPAVNADNSFSGVSTIETTSAASLTSVVSERMI